MRAWILYDEPEILKTNLFKRIYETARKMNIDIRLIKTYDLMLFQNNTNNPQAIYKNEIIVLPDFCFNLASRKNHYGVNVIKFLERHNVFCAPDKLPEKISTNKWLTLLELTKQGLPCIASYCVSPFCLSDNIKERITFPCIVKPLDLCQGVGIFKANNIHELTDHIRLLRKIENLRYVLVQEYLDFRVGVDVRALVLDSKVIAVGQRESSYGGFKSNIASGGQMTAIPHTEEIKSLSIQAAKACGLWLAGIDLLFTKDGLKICEVNAKPGFKGIEDSHDLDIAEKILSSIIEKVKNRTK